MRILIIALVRTGGYQFNDWLALELGYERVHEPIVRNVSTEGKDNIVVKNLINDYEKDINLHNDLKNWDRIIGLTRENTYDTAISHVYALQNKEWRLPYNVTDEWILENENEIKEVEQWFIESTNYLKAIKEIELFVTYEGIYYTKEDIQRVKDYVGIKNAKYKHLLDNSNKLRDRPIPKETGKYKQPWCEPIRFV
jgi:hypothetical protein